MTEKSINKIKTQKNTSPAIKSKQMNLKDIQTKSFFLAKIINYILLLISFWSVNFKKMMSPVISSLLIICLLTISMPASPKLIIGSAVNLHQNATVAFYSGRWYESLVQGIYKYLAGQQTPVQETQEMRDAQVVEIKSNFPDSMTVGEYIQLDAIPVNINDIPVSGVMLDWEIEKPDGETQTGLTGIYIFETTGQYKITVKGANKDQTSTISVSESSFSDNVKDSETPQYKDNSTPENLLPYLDWEPGNIGYAFEPINLRGDTPGKPKLNSNFSITAPILAVSGRAGLDLNLGLTYNSRVWTKMGQDISFDMNKDNPAPGWTLGFGKILNFGGNSIVQFDGNGSVRSFTGAVKTEGNYKVIEGQSNDGSFIKARTYSQFHYQSGQYYFSYAITTLKYPDGTTVEYRDWKTSPNSPTVDGVMRMVPVKITDKHGNYITINNQVGAYEDGRTIDTIKDTLGRIYKFNYIQENGKYYLKSITGPGLKDENGVTTQRTFAIFNYKNHTLAYNFSGLTPKVRDNNNSIKVLSSIYYPATNTGYWFGATDSYSSYGMIRKIEEHKGMSFDSTTGVISSGQVTRQRIYSYPENAATSISDIPEYPTVSETWDGMSDPSSPAVTQYIVDWTSNPRTTTVILPYGQGKTVEYSHNIPDSVKDGVTFKTEVYDGNNFTLRSKDETDWGTGTLSFPAHNNAATYNLTVLRPNSITHTEIDNGVSLSKKSFYDVFGPYNRVLEMRETGYSGEVLRKTKTQYLDKNDNPLTESDWNKPRIINLPDIVEVFDGNSNRIDYTKYTYDVAPINRDYSVIQSTSPCNTFPNSSCSAEFSDERGNLSNIIKYSKVSNSTLDGQYNDGRIYSSTGNIILYNPSSVGVNLSFNTYTSATAYAYPTAIGKGSGSFANSSIGATSIYDYNTGLPLSITDADQQTATFEYDLQTWRLKKTIAPTGAYSVNDFDDLGRVYSQTAYTSTGAVAGKQISRVNGLRMPYRQETLSGIESGNEIYDVVETKYDNLGRVEKSSNPFRSNESTQGVHWSQVFYDEIGRVWKTKKPDGSESFNYFDEISRPNVASSGLGHTSRVKDPTGKEKWYRTDTDGNIAEVVEPNPDGDGSVSTNGLLTKYFYDRLGRLIRTEQGAQERKFRYDSLGRMTHQKMAETKATLADDGAFVGEQTGLWSDYFTYDDISNISTMTDARGVKTIYSYHNSAFHWLPIDPLNRVFSISYDITGTTGVLPSPTVNFEYEPTGNVVRIKSIYSENTVSGNPQRVVTNEFGYDPFGRIAEKKTTLASRPDFPMKTNYSYDSLSRITDVTYPSQYGMDSTTDGREPRKIIHNDFDTAGRIKGLKVNGVDYASNFIFNAASQVTSVKIGPAGANQITETYNYNSQTNLLENQKVLKGATALLDLSYQYQQCSCSTGGSGQITGITNNLDRNKDRAYEFDKLSRLKKVTGGLNQTWSQIYSYDRYGNRYNVNSLGFEALRSNNQDAKHKTEQDKIINESIPMASIVTKDNLLENVNGLIKREETKNGSESLLSLYKNTGQPDNSAAGKGTDEKSISAPENKAVSESNKVETENLKTNENSNLTTPGTPFDFDGDGKADFSTWSRTNANWTIYNRQTAQNNTLQLGASGNQIAPGDYDGDGKTDIAVWNPGNGVWTILQSSTGTIVSQQWGVKGDAIVPADYDGDGKTDIAIWRPETGEWYILKSSDGTWYAITFGAKRFGDIPIVGDYDGDGKADISVWRPSQGDWYIFILQSTNGQVLQPHFGQAGDVPVPADYDGDNITDLAVWRPSNNAWYVLQSSNGQVLISVLGSDAARDVLVPADYDGDGKADMAVWTPSTGTWTVRQSSTGTNITHQLGTNSDVAVPSAYIRRSSSPRGQSVQIPRDGHETLSFDQTSNRITTSGFEYDAAGNQTRIIKADGSALRFQYDAAGKLIKVKNDNYQTITTYTYGIGRERLITQDGDENSTNLTYYAWEGGAVISEFMEAAGNVLLWTKNYIYMGGALLATQDRTFNGENVQFDHPDHLGTRLVTDPGAGTHSEQTTLPFGTELESETTGSINNRFTSYDRSSSTGLDYAVNRFYDSSQGRFTTVDPIKMSSVNPLDPQTLNLYAYTANDPVNRTDPSGLNWGNQVGFNSTGGFPGGWIGGTGTSQQTGWQRFLTGFLGNLFGGGRDYRGFTGTPIYFWQMNTAGITPLAPPPLPGARTIETVNAPLPDNFSDCAKRTGVSSSGITKAAADLIKQISRFEGVSVEALSVTWQFETGFNFQPSPNINGTVKEPKRYIDQPDQWDVGPFHINVKWTKKGVKKGELDISDIQKFDGIGGDNVYGILYKPTTSPDKLTWEPATFTGDPLVNGRIAARRILAYPGTTELEKLVQYAPDRTKRRKAYNDWAPSYKKFYDCYGR